MGARCCHRQGRVTCAPSGSCQRCLVQVVYNQEHRAVSKLHKPWVTISSPLQIWNLTKQGLPLSYHDWSCNCGCACERCSCSPRAM